MGNAPSANDEADTKTNCGCDENGESLVLSYDVWEVSSWWNTRWTWQASGSGYVAVFRARMKDGKILGHKSSVIPTETYNRLGSHSTSLVKGRTFVVSMSKPEGVSIQKYFG